MVCGEVSVFVTLILIAAAFNEITLTNWQNNLTLADEIVACGQDIHGNTLMAAAGATVTVWRRLESMYFDEPRNHTLESTILDAAVSWNGEDIAVVGFNSTKLTIINNRKRSSNSNQTVELTKQPTCLSWAYNG